ncbi:DUF1614 domain-containing protein [Natroniella sulfidigena]|uniref:DUF1614 domain-containing protein n=1 Tax=Natroniella sulfidigena TaxID=723921 RepID=UPI00200AAC70|nr:DUF1614 domain-containing protein [Natroniella sulfidigena]MCK8817756.1 DUF1614 domain-containing protein [Natroniella sulfidigena]
MPIGIIILIVIQILVYFGVAEEMLNEMGLTTSMAFLFLTLMILGSFVDIPISSEPVVTLNVGGAILPIALALYILFNVEEKRVIYRTLLSVLIAGGVIYGVNTLFQFEEGHTLFDINYLYPVIAAVISYLIARSRRAAFITGALGFLMYDLIHLGRITLGGIPGEAEIGGAGAFDAIVLSGIFAVLLVEIFGETRERLAAGGNKGEKDRDNKRNFDRKLVHSEFGELGYKEKEEEQQEERGEDDEE